MLTNLRIKNLALVVDLTLELQPGYTAVTGETGAGKSILIGAINLALGERADRGLIRSGADACTVEATFDLRGVDLPIESFLIENGLEACEDGLLILKRTLTAAGTNRQFINGSPTTLSVLATLGNWLVDIHGPYDHQSLLRPAEQLNLLDGFGKLESLRHSFAEAVQRLAALASARAELIVDDATYTRRVELLRHQVREIDAARVRAEEEEELQLEYRRVSNAARILELGQAALRQLSEDDDSLLNAMGGVGRAFLELKRVDPAAEPLGLLHEQATTLLRELRTDLDHYVERIAVDPARLQQLEERLNLVQSLKRKYGHTLAEVIAFGQDAARELQSLEDRASHLSRIDEQCREVNDRLRQLGGELTRARRRVIPVLQRQIAEELAQLGFRQSHFEIALVSAEPTAGGDAATAPLATGFDQVEFLFAPNPGEPPRPLRAIASSGEMARVMLALKTVLAVQDSVPLLIFDEVDANIGGDTAQTVGRKMREIGRHRQVLCITHLAPVAARASHHFAVSKTVQLERTSTRIDRLEGATRIDELARMLGGPGEAAGQHARALLAAAEDAAAPRKTRASTAALKFTKTARGE
jgi:DNA repair protein RecN (Recombination protein N)